ncbi:MAG TPA: BlaI/MecI/CopY family transcriptional regulator [Oscillospiraceae bacterium]|nr:BlaI/MecI/CopY family transcriptional regulator [Oscillospiraceae bacterium]HNW04930.1 BlaI/MecI/CopY family transcriptional regulator [Oscillospiraceae bacterium]HPW00678.1 BlaI/MecI/CopY family transcriptional regulator [Oscillospiraceae bacterium]
MESGIRTLPETELAVMIALWDSGSPLTGAQIGEALGGSRGWATTTVLTFLSRLVKKGFVLCEKKGRGNLYSARVTKAEYLDGESGHFLDRFYDSSIMNFFISSCVPDALSDEEVEQLKKVVYGIRSQKSPAS